MDERIKTLFERANDGDALNASFDKRCQSVLNQALYDHPEIPEKALRHHWYGQILEKQMDKKKEKESSP